MSATCTIKRCNAEATVLVKLDRLDSDAAQTDNAWTGHLETAYCGQHAVERPSAVGIEKYGDVWTLQPLAPARGV